LKGRMNTTALPMINRKPKIADVPRHVKHPMALQGDRGGGGETRGERISR
jgi:hypothetical protein